MPLRTASVKLILCEIAFSEFALRAAVVIALLTLLSSPVVIYAQDEASKGTAPPTANPLASVPECVPGKLADYEKLGSQGCRIGDIQFSAFTRGAASNGLSSRAISITPGTSIDSTDPALVFEAPWVGRPQTATLVFSYKVSALPPAKPLIAASLQMQYGEITGTGEASIRAQIVPSAARSFGDMSVHLQLKLAADLGKKDTDEADLRAPATELRVSQSVVLASGKNGSARINGFMTVFQLQGVKSGTK
jgi:hypothetical protein